MKLLVLLSICICSTQVRSDAGVSKEGQSKLSSSSANSLSAPQKVEYQYQNLPKYNYQNIYQPVQQLPQQQQQSHFQYVIPQGPAQPAPQQYEVSRNRLIQAHQAPQPTAMIIIAQPAFVPANMLYGNIAQQLLHFFQTNPQARHQLLHGAYSHQPQYIQPIAHVPQASPAHYHPTGGVAASASHAYQPVAAPSRAVYQPGQISQAAEQAAQQYVAPRTAAAPIKTAPAIITGFENFTPEQQEKIKAQLSQHFGPLQPLNVGGNNQAVRVANSGPQNNYFPSIKYQASQNNLSSEEFVPSQQLKHSDGNSEEGDAKTQYGTKM